MNARAFKIAVKENNVRRGTEMAKLVIEPLFDHIHQTIGITLSPDDKQTLAQAFFSTAQSSYVRGKKSQDIMSSYAQFVQSFLAHKQQLYRKELRDKYGFEFVGYDK